MGPVNAEEEVDFVQENSQVKMGSVASVVDNPPEKQNDPKKKKKQGSSFEDVERYQALLAEINSQDELKVTKFLCKFIEGSIKDFAKYIIKIEAHKIDEITAKEEFYNDLFTLSSKAKVESGITDEQYASIIGELYESQYVDKLHKNYSEIIKNTYPSYGGKISEMVEDIARDIGPKVPEFSQVLSYAKQSDTLKMTTEVRLAMSDICEYCGLKSIAKSFKDKAIKVEVSKRSDIINKLKSTALVRDIINVASPSPTPLVGAARFQGRNSRDG